MPFPVTEHVAKTKRHTTAYLACGAADVPDFLHGWPEPSISWRHQLPLFAELALQLLFPMSSESMGDHDSGPDDWWRVS